MRGLKKVFILVCLGGVFLISNSLWAAKIAIVDTTKVVKEYEKAKAAQERLEKELADKRDELKEASDNLEKMKTELDTQKGIVSEKKYDKLQEKFSAKQDVFREKYQETQALLMKKQRALLEDIVKDVKEIVADIAKKEKFDLVLEKEMVLYHDGKDITYKVLDKLNSSKK